MRRLIDWLSFFSVLLIIGLGYILEALPWP